MAIMIVDPNKETREAAANIVRWIDNRHHIELACDGASAWPAAVEWQPVLILCEPDLPDVRGETLCSELRRHLQSSRFIAYTNNTSIDQMGAFDGVLTKPPPRLSVLTHFLEARKNSKAPRRNPPADSAKQVGRRARLPREKVRIEADWISIKVATHGDPLKFTVPMPAGATVELALQRIGKSTASWFSMIRNGVEIHGTLGSTLQNGDELLIRM